MNNPDINMIISIIADSNKSGKIEEALKLLDGYKVLQYNSLREFILAIDFIKPNIVIADAVKIKELQLKSLKQFLKEEFDLPLICLTDKEDKLFFTSENITQPYEYIQDESDAREVELALIMTLEKFSSGKTIKNNELQFKALLENSSDIFTIVDAEGNVKYESPSIKKLLGYLPDELVGKKFFELIYAEDLQNCKKSFFNNISLKKESFVCKFRYLAKNGQTKSIEAIFNNLLGVEGVDSIIITGKDVTDKRTIEKKFLTNIKRYNTLIENLPMGIYRSTPLGELLMANAFLIKMLGYSSFAELEKVDINSSYVQQRTREIFKELVDKYGEAKGFEFEIKKKDGEILFVRDTARAIYDENGKVIYYEGVLEDISDKKRYENEIICAKENLEKADKLKTCFMAHLSHEIRTPVNSILTFVSLLKEEFEASLTDELQDSFSIIGNSADRLIRTIDLIMNISSLQTGNFDTRHEWLDIENDIINDVLRDYELKAKYKGIKLVFTSKAVKKKIYADRYSTSQIFCNLIDNAVKYTPKNGEIEIRLYNNEEKILVDIIDSGVGISNEYLPNLFTPFTQEEMGYTRKFDGNGLGLAIAKKYAELNNAMINVKSLKGQGSNFTVIFENPVKVPTENFS